MPAAVSGAQHEPRAYPAALSRNQTTAAVPPSASAPGTVRCPRVNGLPAPPGGSLSGTHLAQLRWPG